jgi:hypothetical protein
MLCGRLRGVAVALLATDRATNKGAGVCAEPVSETAVWVPGRRMAEGCGLPRREKCAIDFIRGNGSLKAVDSEVIRRKAKGRALQPGLL